MSTSQPSSARHRPARRHLMVGLALTGMLVALLVVALGGDGKQDKDRGALLPAAAQPNGPTMFRIASLNLLGAGHTDGRRPRRGFEKSPQRLRWSMQALDEQRIDVVGFQEMHWPQAVQFGSEYTDAWSYFPGTSLSQRAAHNSIAWRNDTWTAVKKKIVMVPYFNGNAFPMPYVLLKHNVTGQRMWLINVHNPANAHGNAQKYRDRAVAKEISLINALRADHPERPVYLTGDMNDHEKFFCPITGKTDIVSASGGYATPDSCIPPGVMKVDWLLGTAGINNFTEYLVSREPLIAKSTDHPLIAANATISDVRTRRRGIDQVVIVAVDGLSTQTLRKVPKSRTPNLAGLAQNGTSTMQARTNRESTRSLPNLVSMVTGTRVSAAKGGHGIRKDSDAGSVVATSAGRYVPSIFDRIHDIGRRTSLFATNVRSELLTRSWDKTNGGIDRRGVDDGRNKITTTTVDTRTLTLTQAASQYLAAGRRGLTVIELDLLERTGLQYGFDSKRFRRKIDNVDRRIGNIVDAVRSDPAISNRTAIIVMGTSGGAGTDNGDPTLASNYEVPIYVTGPDVAAGSDLYGLNPGWSNPGSARGRYTGDQPIRTGDVANLALTLMGLPPLGQSNFNQAQRLTLFR